MCIESHTHRYFSQNAFISLRIMKISINYCGLRVDKMGKSTLQHYLCSIAIYRCLLMISIADSLSNFCRAIRLAGWIGMFLKCSALFVRDNRGRSRSRFHTKCLRLFRIVNSASRQCRNGFAVAGNFRDSPADLAEEDPHMLISAIQRLFHFCASTVKIHPWGLFRRQNRNNKPE